MKSGSFYLLEFYPNRLPYCNCVHHFIYWLYIRKGDWILGMETLNLKFTIILIIAFNGFFLGALVSAALLIRNPKSSQAWMFSFLFVIFSLFQVHYIFFQSQLLSAYKLANLLPIAAIYMLGPVLLQITSHSLNNGYELSRKDFFHFIPMIIITGIAWMIILRCDYPKELWLEGYYYNNPLILMIGSIGNLIFLLYFFLSVHHFMKAFFFTRDVIKNNPSAKAVFVILLGMALTIVFDTCAVLFNSIQFMELSLGCLNLVIISLFLILFKYPEYPKAIQKVVATEKKRRSYLEGVDLDGLNEEINQLMETNEIFTDENLSLDTLAKAIGVSKHQLSEFLNRRIKENFPTFINRHRIQKAKKLLILDPDQKILAIAFDVGFKSKSTFNAAFLKFEGVTPAQFRKNHH